jgi:predicted  nucleic acid-binding Zn-ribbon protein
MVCCDIRKILCSKEKLMTNKELLYVEKLKEYLKYLLNWIGEKSIRMTNFETELQQLENELHETQEDGYSESDYRERIVNELSTEQLRDRLCETKTELEKLRIELEEWENKYLAKDQYGKV